MNENITRLDLGGREFILVGTAHVSRESVDEVQRIITEEKPERVCVEIDGSRYSSMTQKQDWSSLNIYQVIKQKKGFLLLGNLVLASFQRRLGIDLGVKPGEEMMKAVETAQALNIPFSFSDREIQITLKRAWAKTGLWGKSKLLTAMLSSVFSTEKLSPEEIEELKKKSELEGMMDELAQYLPSVKEVLIDERDSFLAANIYKSEEKRVLAVVGAGHIPGVIRRLTQMYESGVLIDTAEISAVPRGGVVSKVLGWLIPAAIVALIAWGFFSLGKGQGIEMLWIWLAANGG
ncbi:MAG: TraB domain-containing protein, partial [Spirochaetales bacterium]|nr:TraB domain-containing protein [Spirochaetales bacterium]